MHTKFFTTIEEALGHAKDRYFGLAFKAYKLRLLSFSIETDKISGKISIIYNGPSRPRNESVHLGSIEYTALSLLFAGYGLSKILGLSLDQINMASMYELSFKIKKIVETGETPFEIKLEKNRLHYSSKQGTLSTFIIRISTTVIRITIDHQRRYYHWLTARQSLDPFSEQLYTIGYKQREVDIHSIVLNTVSNKIKGQFTCKSQIRENEIDGLCSTRFNILPTDALLVFGQLMQTLLYQKLDANRKECPNIWLRSMNLLNKTPLLEEQCTTQLTFNAIKELRQRHETWQIIDLSGTVGTYEGFFQIAHKLPK